jgi:hypothetical protein
MIAAIDAVLDQLLRQGDHFRVSPGGTPLVLLDGGERRVGHRDGVATILAETHRFLDEIADLPQLGVR